MKKIVSFTLILFIIIVVASGYKTNNSIEDYTAIVKDESGVQKYPIGMPSIEDLKEIVNKDPITTDYIIQSYYANILAFLTGDSEALANFGGMSLDPDMYVNTGISTLKFSSYEIKEEKFENEDNPGSFCNKLIFSFTVSESECDAFPIGDYCYCVDNVWTPFPNNEYLSDQSTDNPYFELANAVDHITNYGGISWENGAPTSYDNNFNTFVYRSVVCVLSDYYSHKAVMSDENVKKGALSMFGLEDYTPNSEVYEIVDGVWTPKYYYGGLSVVSDILDIRDAEAGRYEVDVQFYADMTHMIPSHKITLFVSENDDPIFKYCFEKSVIIERSIYDPYWWSAS